MSKLRNRLIEVQKEETLRKVLTDRYNETSDEEKTHLLSFLGDTIERDVDKMIREEIDSFNENTPFKKKRKKLKNLTTAANVILTLVGGYAVNEESWIFVAFIAILLIINHIISYTSEE